MRQWEAIVTVRIICTGPTKALAMQDLARVGGAASPGGGGILNVESFREIKGKRLTL